LIRGSKLFQQESLQRELEARREAFLGEIDKISQSQFEASTDSDVVAHLLARARLNPIELDEDQASIHFEATKVDISKDYRRHFIERPTGPVYAPGRCAVITIPFSGDGWLFEYKTNPFYTGTALYGEVLSPSVERVTSEVRLFASVANDEETDTFERLIADQRAMVRLFLKASRDQVLGFNNNLETAITKGVAARRKRDIEHRKIAATLNIALMRRPSAPPISSVAISPRYIPPLKSSAPAYGIADSDYEMILHFIRHQCRTYETAPDTYAVHDEEGLRDIILSQLNGHFAGAATGETFRGRGKTDIRIEAEDRSAFVAECKIWTGPAGITKAVQQLLSYVMWRDSKTALIVFNKGKVNMPTVIGKLHEALSTLTSASIQAAGSQGEWETKINVAGSVGHEISLHVFAFDIRPRRS
jgi:hypothetical protein